MIAVVLRSLYQVVMPFDHCQTSIALKPSTAVLYNSSLSLSLPTEASVAKSAAASTSGASASIGSVASAEAASAASAALSPVSTAMSATASAAAVSAGFSSSCANMRRTLIYVWRSCAMRFEGQAQTLAGPIQDLMF